MQPTTEPTQVVKEDCTSQTEVMELEKSNTTMADNDQSVADLASDCEAVPDDTTPAPADETPDGLENMASTQEGSAKPHHGRGTYKSRGLSKWILIF